MGIFNHVSVIVLLLVLSACAPKSFNEYQGTIASFQAATEQTASVTTGYLLELNEFERNLELDRLRADPNRVLDIPKKFLNDKFDPEAIQARVQAFRVLETYTGLLAAVADSDAPERWSETSVRLKTSADTFLEDVSKLKDKGQTNLADFTAPLQKIIEFAGKAIINRKRADILDDVIITAKPAIDDISRLLKEDMKTVVLQRITVIDEPLIDIVDEYEKVQKEPASSARETKRLKILENLQKTLEERDQKLTTLQGLEQALNGFDRAHEALVSYAKSDKGPQDLSDLIAVVERYRAVAESLFESFKKTTATS